MVYHEYYNLKSTKHEYLVIGETKDKYECACFRDFDNKVVDTTGFSKLHKHDVRVIREASEYSGKYAVSVNDLEAGTGSIIKNTLKEAVDIWKVFGILNVYRITTEQLNDLKDVPAKEHCAWLKNNCEFICQY